MERGSLRINSLQWVLLLNRWNRWQKTLLRLEEGSLQRRRLFHSCRVRLMKMLLFNRQRRFPHRLHRTSRDGELERLSAASRQASGATARSVASSARVGCAISAPSIAFLKNHQSAESTGTSRSAAFLKANTA